MVWTTQRLHWCRDPRTRPKIDKTKNIDSIQKAKESAGGGTWELESEEPQESGESRESEEDDQLLGPEDARLYRGVAARLNYIAPDRPDIAYAVKESARGMSAPRASAMRKLRKIGKYLIGCPRLVSKFVWQDMPTKVT